MKEPMFPPRVLFLLLQGSAFCDAFMVAPPMQAAHPFVPRADSGGQSQLQATPFMDDEEEREYAYARRRRRGRLEAEEEYSNTGQRRRTSDIYSDEEEYDDDDEDFEVDFDDWEDDDDDDDDDLFGEDHDLFGNVLVPNPFLDNIDPDGAAERFPELARDPRFWFDMLLFLTLMDFMSFVGPQNPFPEGVY